MFKNKKFFWPIIIFVSCLFAAVVFYWFQFFITFEQKLLDNLFVRRMTPADILIIGIDDQTLKELGRWPWPRKIHAELLEKLAKFPPKIVAIDINFSEPSADKKEDEALATALKKLPVILPVEAQPLLISGAQFSAKNLLEPIPIFKENAAGLAHVNILADKDGVARYFLKEITFQNQKFVSFGEKIFEKSYGYIESNPAENLVDKFFPISAKRRINFSGEPGHFPIISFQSVFKEEVNLKIFQNKIVLIGVTAPDLRDAVMTPTSEGKAMTGVEMHANILENFISNFFLRDVSPASGIILLILLSSVFFAVFFNLSRIYAKLIWLAALLGAYNLAVFLFFDKGFVLSLLYPNFALLLIFLAQIFYQYFLESKEKRFIRQTFKYYLAPEVVEEILKNPEKIKLGGERKEITILFSDIRGFTSLSEKSSPEEAVRILNEYFTAMGEIINKNQGVLDKFIGDAIMAFWGAPQKIENHAEMACRTALEMCGKLRELNKIWQERGLPVLNIGIGINTGGAVVGNVGSEKRFDYTVIGDTVNLASRLEGLNKEFNASIIISESVFQKIKDILRVRAIGEVKVKGKEEMVKIYELIAKD